MTDTVQILQFVEDHDEFLITYYAKKHNEIITRRGTWTKPNTDTQGKHFQSKEGKDIFIYWDINAEPNQNGNKWRQATNQTVKEVA
jgi:hypothetical protein